MFRRRFLAATGTTLAGVALAGCSGSEPGDGGEQGTTSATTEGGGGTDDRTSESTESTETSRPEVSFDLASFEAPKEAAMGEPLPLKVVIENTGDRPAAFSSPIRLSGSGGGWHTAATIQTEVIEPGKRATWSTEYTHPYSGTANFRIPKLQRAFSVDVSPKTLSFGGTHVVPTDFAFTVRDVSLTDSYRYERSNGSTTEVSAGSGSQWAFVHVAAENRADYAQRPPSRSGVSLLVGSSGTTLSPAGIPRERGRYPPPLDDSGTTTTTTSGSEGLEPGGTASGWIAYEVPADRSVSDLVVQWREGDGVGRWTVRWVA
ncbi:twin-arginine translocation signal domain-containing protein [Halomicrococcus sp. NG-SE-24]|uniref:twin-arginine translocation signal domain-containing protein n=1 Tax=Halomicrococcus sp. NG-SE-24 TaxID=3436928 RepID=UPI003D961D85